MKQGDYHSLGFVDSVAEFKCQIKQRMPKCQILDWTAIDSKLLYVLSMWFKKNPFKYILS